MLLLAHRRARVSIAVTDCRVTSVGCRGEFPLDTRHSTLPPRPPLIPSVPTSTGSLAHLRQCLIDGEARRLAGRKLLERLQERRDDCPRRQPHRPDRWAGMFSSLAEPCESHCSPPSLPTPPPRLQGREGRASRRGVVPSGHVWVLSCILRSTSSRLKLAAFWRCGYSLNVCRNCPTKACAGTSRKTWLTNQS